MPFALGRAPLIVTKPRVDAADPRNATLFAARAALRRAIGTRASAELQVTQLKSLVEHLEAERRA